jgi:hypothetical protein
VCDKQTYHGAARVSPSASITILKQLIPTVGQLYGELSQEAHLDLGEHLRFLRFGDSESRVVVAHGRDSFLSGAVLLDLADLWSVVYERSQQRHFSEFENWIGSPDGLELREDRPFLGASAQAKAELLAAES